MDPKQHILNAAQSVFARHGFRQTAMSMVADEAGLSRQALYHHFASKEALFAALVDALHETALAAAKAAVRSGGTAADTIADVMTAYRQSLLSRLSGSPFMAELIEESGRQCGPAVAAFAKRFDKHLAAAIAGLVGAGRLKLKAGISPRELAEMVSIAARGVKSAYAGESEARYARALERMVAVVCAGAEALSDAKGARRTKKTEVVDMRGRRSSRLW